MRKSLCFAVIAVLLCFCLSGCSRKKTGSETDASVPTNGISTAYPDKEVGFQLEAPTAGETIAVMHTSMGDIFLRFFPEAAPKAVKNFLTHAKNGYYNGLTFHRVINNFMIQSGDPTATGRGGESIYNGQPFSDEFDQKLLNLRGSLSMANCGVNTNGSQFFINQAGKDTFGTRDSYNYETQAKTTYEQWISQYGEQMVSQYYQSWKDVLKEITVTYIYDWVPDDVWSLYEKTGGNISLDGAWRESGGHTVFGQVFSGMDIVDKIAAVKTENEKPVTDVIIRSIDVTTYAG